MITVKFLGGAKKSFRADQFDIDKHTLTIHELILFLLEKKPKDTPDLDFKNILIAVNGVDSSALEGKSTQLKHDDIVSVIPIIHGGSPKRVFFTISKNVFQIVEINNKNSNCIEYIDLLRKKFPKIKIQAISSQFILSIYHLKRILYLSVHSLQKNLLITNKLESDILLRFAISTQISEAINSVGIKPKQNFILICAGDKKSLNKLYHEISFNCIKMFSKDHSSFLKKNFKISNKTLESFQSKKPLADILVEKAAILV